MSKIVFEVKAPSSEEESTKPSPEESVSLRNESQKRWTVSQLTRKIRLLLENELRSIVLEGEVSNYKKAASGHLYFSLKDNNSQIAAVMFKGFAQKLPFRMEEGLEVIAKGHVTVYQPRGEYQLQVSSLEPQGIGALQFAFEQLKKKLEGEGLFEQKHKAPIPPFPRKIGIVTSKTGAVIHDMQNVLQRRFAGIPVLFFPASVQGDQAVPELIAGIKYLNQIAEREEIDVLIVGRGGGSIEDLWAFNDEKLARVIFASQVPIISAVGHETDFTIADFVSDLRAPTPSAAMELAVPNQSEVKAWVESMRQQLLKTLSQFLKRHQEEYHATLAQLRSPQFRIDQHQQQIDHLRHRLQKQQQFLLEQAKQSVFSTNQLLHSKSPIQLLGSTQQLLDQFSLRLHRNMQQFLQTRKNQLQNSVKILDSKSPLALMKRGYGLVSQQNGKRIRSVDDVQPKEQIQITLEDGKIHATVIDVESK